MAVSSLNELSSLGFVVLSGEGRVWTLETPDAEKIQVVPYLVSGRATKQAIAKAKKNALGIVALRSSVLPAPLIVAESSTPGLEAAAGEAEFHLFTRVPKRLIFSGVVYGEPRTIAPSHIGRVRKLSDKKTALLRMAILKGSLPAQQEVADYLQTSQPYISKIVKELSAELQINLQNLSQKDRRKLLDQLLLRQSASYFTQHWKSGKPVVEQAKTVLDAYKVHGKEAIIGGEVAADKFASWKHPDQGLIYSESPLDLEENGFTEVKAERQTLEVRIIRDKTVWQTARWWAHQTNRQESLYVDPVLTYLDLKQSALSDSAEAAEKLLEKILRKEL